MSLDAVGIICDDPELSIDFYMLLGLDFKLLGEGHYEAIMPSGLRLMIDTVDLIKRINPDWIKSEGSNVVLCFKRDSAEAVDDCYQALVAAGAVSQKSPWDAFWGQRYACVFDPDGNQVDVFSDLTPAA